MYYQIRQRIKNNLEFLSAFYLWSSAKWDTLENYEKDFLEVLDCFFNYIPDDLSLLSKNCLTHDEQELFRKIYHEVDRISAVYDWDDSNESTKYSDWLEVLTDQSWPAIVRMSTGLIELMNRFDKVKFPGMRIRLFEILSNPTEASLMDLKVIGWENVMYTIDKMILIGGEISLFNFIKSELLSGKSIESMVNHIQDLLTLMKENKGVPTETKTDK